LTKEAVERRVNLRQHLKSLKKFATVKTKEPSKLLNTESIKEMGQMQSEIT
jgi:hypothetical protein